MGRLVIDGNSVYEIDEECLKRQQIPAECGEYPPQAVQRQPNQEKLKNSAQKRRTSQ